MLMSDNDLMSEAEAKVIHAHQSTAQQNNVMTHTCMCNWQFPLSSLTRSRMQINSEELRRSAVDVAFMDQLDGLEGTLRCTYMRRCFKVRTSVRR